MHMADALISPAVGGVMWAATACLAVYSAKQVQKEMDESKVPLMGVMGALVFASQMINFAIPATGSSGHLGGGMLLAIVLGPYAAFITMASILTVQALFFADGGLLALGCNIFNLAFFPSFVMYPVVYRRLAGRRPTQGKLVAAATLGAVLSLQCGAFGVVVETIASGITDLPFTAFVWLMQPIHLAIGLVEGAVTAMVVWYVWRLQPEVLQRTADRRPLGQLSLRSLLVALLFVAVVTAGMLSWFASTDPDGLEWSIQNLTGGEELALPEGVHATLAAWQEQLAIFPDYQFRQPEGNEAKEAAGQWPAVDGGHSLAGIAGSLLTLALAGAFGKALQRSA